MSDTEQMAETRKPGRPKSTQATPVVKKGRPSWKPASVTDVANKEAGYRYRWVNKTPDNLAKKEAEGWETVSKGISADKAYAVDDAKVHTGKNMTSIYEKHDVLLQRMPEEIAQERDAYMNTKTQKRTTGLTSHFKREAREAGGAPVHGEITISSLREQQTID